MNSRFFLSLASLALALGFANDAGAAAQAAGKSVNGEPARKLAAVAAPSWRDATYSDSATVQLRLRELPVERINELVNNNKRRGLKPTQIGINRATATEGLGKALPQLQWQALKAGGMVTRLKIASPDAVGMRVGLQVDGMDPRAELRFAGSDNPAKVVASVSAVELKRLSNGGIYWSPATDGEAQVIEIYTPIVANAKAIKVQLPRVSHLVADSKSAFSITKGIGDSGTCNVDVICRVATLGANFTNAKNSVARMVFTDPSGTFTCTGTLLADTDAASQIPYFYTADHCIADQATASTLNTFWGFEATACGNGVSATTTQNAGGATYLYSSATTDAALLRMNTAPPAGAFFAGWNSAALSAATAINGIHHPSADLKKSSLGTVMAIGSAQHEVAWTSGTTEGGSSGSALFTTTGAGGAYQLRGGLFGGTASCSNSGSTANTENRDYYSRFDLTFPSISQYLAPAGGTFQGPTRDNSGVWYVPAESGWGITAYQYSNAAQVLFVTWYAYDGTGKANWYQLSGAWTGTNINSGTVLKYSGPAWGPTFNPAAVSSANVGTATINFTSSSAATLTYTVDGQTRTVTLSKFGT